MSEEPTKVLIIRESAVESIVKDIGAALIFFVLIGAGVWMGSEVMQWAGFLIVTLGLLVAINSKSRMTIDEARKHLDLLEAKIKK